MQKKKSIKSAIKNIYEILNERIPDEAEFIKLKIKKNPKKLFLNGDDPFITENWAAGDELVFNLPYNIPGAYKVKECLTDYKELLMAVGGVIMKPQDIPKPITPEHDSKSHLIEALLDKLISQSDEYHDVIFVVGEEKKEIGANRYVLSAASTHFKSMFNGGFNEAAEKGTRVLINDIQPDVFWVFLRWLYGQPFEAAAKSILDEFKTDQESYQTCYLNFMIRLLELTDFYGAKLKSEVEGTIINSSCISFHNVCDVLEWSKRYKATPLKDYCKGFIKKYRKLVIDQRCIDKNDDNERSSESAKLDSLLDEE